MDLLLSYKLLYIHSHPEVAFLASPPRLDQQSRLLLRHALHGVTENIFATYRTYVLMDHQTTPSTGSGGVLDILVAPGGVRALAPLEALPVEDALAPQKGILES